MTAQMTRPTYGRQAALVSGVAGVIALVLLVLFFALAQPWRTGGSEFDWLGPANDVAVVVEFAALVPVARAVRARVGGRLAAVATSVGVASMAGVVALQVALLAGVLEFDVQVYLVTACTAVTFGWLLGVSLAGRHTLPRPLWRLGAVVGASCLAGFAVVGFAFLLPAGSIGQYAVLGVGALAGAVGWFGFPVWPLLLARQVLREER